MASNSSQEQNIWLAQLAALGTVALQLMDSDEEEEPTRRLWVRDWVARRENSIPLFKEIETEDKEKFFVDFRLYPDDFDKLLAR